MNFLLLHFNPPGNFVAEVPTLNEGLLTVFILVMTIAGINLAQAAKKARKKKEQE